jgi:hypothetical protein
MTHCPEKSVAHHGHQDIAEEYLPLIQPDHSYQTDDKKLVQQCNPQEHDSYSSGDSELILHTPYSANSSGTPQRQSTIYGTNLHHRQQYSNLLPNCQ